MPLLAAQHETGPHGEATAGAHDDEKEAQGPVVHEDEHDTGEHDQGAHREDGQQEPSDLTRSHRSPRRVVAKVTH
jgi:hypothetical protein